MRNVCQWVDNFVKKKDKSGIFAPFRYSKRTGLSKADYNVPSINNTWLVQHGQIMYITDVLFPNNILNQY